MVELIENVRMSLVEGDPFWDAYEEEDRSVERGTEAGIKHGEELGWVEGWELGVKQGYQLGLEIGFFSGSLRMLKYFQKKDSNLIPEKVVVMMERLDVLLNEFPLTNTTDIDLQQKLGRIQQLHKQIVSNLGIGKHFSQTEDSIDF